MHCNNFTESVHLAELLIKYQDIFGASDQDVRRTDLVHHSNPLVDEAKPIRQPPHRLGPAKELETERQVQEL